MNLPRESSPIEFESVHSLRRPDEIMRPSRIGMFFPHRLSFMRVLSRALHRERAAVDRSVWRMDSDGFGQAVYTVELGGNSYSLVAFFELSGSRTEDGPRNRGGLGCDFRSV